MQLKGGLLFTGDKIRFPFPRDLNNFQPRAGAAYRVTPRTVIRGGYGLSFLPTFDINGSNGFAVSTPFVSSNDGGLTPAGKLSNTYPGGILTPTGRSQGLATLAGSGYTFGYNGRAIPYVYQFSLGFQHELPMRVLIDVSYSGNRAFSLNTSKGINEITAEQFKLGATVANSQLLRPYPQFTGITEANRTIGKLWYDSLQLRVEKRFSRGFHVLASYTFSKNLEATGYLNAQDQIGQLARVLTAMGPERHRRVPVRAAGQRARRHVLHGRESEDRHAGARTLVQHLHAHHRGRAPELHRRRHAGLPQYPHHAGAAGRCQPVQDLHDS